MINIWYNVNCKFTFTESEVNSLAEIEETKLNDEELFKSLEASIVDMLWKHYSRGLAEGGKTFVASIYHTIITDEENNESPKDIITHVKEVCRNYFSTNEKYLDSESGKTIEEVVEKMKEA